MNVVKKNMIANVLSSVWLSVIGFIFIPIYIKFLGVAAWGLIGIFSTLQIVFSLLDTGLSSTLNREMARLSEVSQSGQIMRDLLRTLEWVYWCVAIFVVFCIAVLSPLIAKHWLDSSHLSVTTIHQSLLIMGVVIALQMPIGLYSGGLMGLQKQVLLSSINVFVSTFRSFGSLLILWFVSPTVQAFFLWQVVTSVLNVLLLVYHLWRNIPPTAEKASFRIYLIKSIGRFAAGMSGISILGIILTQLDKLVLSKLISLEELGYYMLANALAMTIGRLISPVFFSIYPRFTQLAVGNNPTELKILYHKVCQLVAVFILPIAVIVTFFSYDIMLLWTKNPSLAQKTYKVVSILICGSAINAIMHPPYALQLAFGWTKLSFFKNVIAIILVVPLIIYLARHYGVTGAASAWLILNIGYVIFEIGVMHLKLLKTEKIKWYLQDVFLPTFVSVSIVYGAKYILGERHLTPVPTAFFLAITLFITVSITALVTPFTRSVVFEIFSKGSLLKLSKL